MEICRAHELRAVPLDHALNNSNPGGIDLCVLAAVSTAGWKMRRHPARAACSALHLFLHDFLIVI